MFTRHTSSIRLTNVARQGANPNEGVCDGTAYQHDANVMGNVAPRDTSLGHLNGALHVHHHIDVMITPALVTA